MIHACVQRTYICACGRVCVGKVGNGFWEGLSNVFWVVGKALHALVETESVQAEHRMEDIFARCAMHANTHTHTRIFMFVVQTTHARNTHMCTPLDRLATPRLRPGISRGLCWWWFSPPSLSLSLSLSVDPGFASSLAGRWRTVDASRLQDSSRAMDALVWASFALPHAMHRTENFAERCHACNAAFSWPCPAV